MGYNLLGSMTSLVDPSGNQTTWQFDGLNRETSDTNQLGFSETFQYNAAGKVTQDVDKDGRIRTFQYNDLGQQTTELWGVPGGGSVSIVNQTAGSGGHTDAQYDVTLPQYVDGGTWALDVSFNGTGFYVTPPIAWNATAATVQNTIAALSSVGAGNVAVSGSGSQADPFIVTFIAALDGANVTLFADSSSSFTYNGSPIDVYEAQQGQAAVNSSAVLNGSNVPNGSQATISENTPSGVAFSFYVNSTTTADYIQGILNNDGDTAVFGGAAVYGTWPDFSIRYSVVIPAGYHLSAAVATLNWNPGQPAQDEEQIVSVPGAMGGTFTLSSSGRATAPINYNASAADIQNALAAILGQNNVIVAAEGPASASTWAVWFVGVLADSPQPLLSADPSNLVVGPYVVPEAVGASGTDAAQSITIEAFSGTFTLSFSGDTTAPIDFGASADAVAAALNALPSVDTRYADGDYGFVAVTGTGALNDPYLVTFAGIWSGQSMPLLTADTSQLMTVLDTFTTAYDADGEITSTGDNFSHYAYTYNGQGEVATVDNAGTPGVPHVVLSSGWDAAGNRSSSSASIAGTADFLNSYSYNTLSQLVQIVQQGQSGGNVVAPKEIDYALNANGDVTRRSGYNFIGVGPRYDIASEAISYNPQGLLSGISMTSHAGQVALNNLTYSYDSLARVTTFGSIDGTANYGYDPTSQLTSATYTAASGHTEPPSLSLAFDKNGNRSNVNGASTTISSNNEVTNDGTFTYQFDADGNRTVRTRISTAYASDYRTTYAFDYRNRLTDVEMFDNSGVLTQHVHYVYNVWNELIERDVDPNGSGTYTQIAHYVWDSSAPPSVGQNGQPPSALGNIVLAFNGSQQLTTRYVNGPNVSAYDRFFSTLAEEDVTSTTSAGSVYFYLLDKESTLTDVADSSGSLYDHLEYNAFGQLFSESNPSVSHLGGYAGGLYDPATGLLYFINRWYDPTATVWISADPTGFRAGDPSLRRYVGNSPTNATDPDGLKVRGVGDLLPRFKKYLDKDLNILIDKEKDRTGYARAEILQGLFKCNDTFVVKGNTIDENVKNLFAQFEARRKALIRTWTKKFKFGAGSNFKENHTITPVPDFDTEPGKYYDSINNDKTSIACLRATELVMACGAGGTNKLLDRNITDQDDFVPGDWGYIYNDAHQLHVSQDDSDKPWDYGLEGENIIYAGSLGFWGHFGPGNTYFPFDKWMHDVGSWTSQEGDPSKPRLSTRVQFPAVGIDHIEEN